MCTAAAVVFSLFATAQEQADSAKIDILLLPNVELNEVNVLGTWAQKDDPIAQINLTEKAIEALQQVKDAGMDPYLNITVGHYNANTEHFKELLDYSKNQKYKTLLNVAVPSGMWQKMDEIICDDKDREYLRKIRKEYKNLVRNIWNPFDKNHEKILGCTTVNRVYVTPIGDVLVCPYVHIKIGNIFEQSLKEIIDHGFSIKYFRNHSDLCLAGEDKEFINKFMTKSGQSIFKPALASEIFSKEDFVE